jgi:hypothetical protein
MKRRIAVAEHESADEIEEYGDAYITSYVGVVPKWLKAVYILAPIWGIVWFCFFWNGSYGWLDRGSWNQLQRAANTTFPTVNADELPSKKIPAKSDSS